MKMRTSRRKDEEKDNESEEWKIFNSLITYE